MNNVTVKWLLLPKMSLNFASERMEAVERAHNFVVDTSLQATSTVVEVSRCRSPCQSPPSSLVHRSLTQVRCRTVAVHRRCYQTLWASTTLAVGSSTDLFVFSLTGTISSRSSVTLLVFSRANHNTSQLLTTFYVVLSPLLLKSCFKSLQAPQTSRWLVHGRDVTRRG